MTGRNSIAVLLLSASLSGCFGTTRKPLLPAAPVAPQPPPEALPPIQGTSIPPAVSIPPEPAPATSRPATRRPSPPKPIPARPAAGAPEAAAEALSPTAPAVPAAPAPQLGVLMDAAAQRQFRADLERMTGSAQAAVARSKGRSLSAAQRETVERILSFLEQAAGAKEKDPSTALQLARRADLLGQELVKSLPK